MTHTISELSISFDLPELWSFISKTGKLEQGHTQYIYSHEQIEEKDRIINPSISITVDKGSWFADEQTYINEKLDFHKAIDNEVEEKQLPEAFKPKLEQPVHYYEGESGLENNPYGQKMILVMFWTEHAGFHMEIQTSVKDFEEHKDAYMHMISSIRTSTE